jgi:hypothetical protein
MKLKATLLVVTLSAFAASAAFANEEHHPDAKAEKSAVVKEQKAATDAGNDSMKNMDMHEHMKMMHGKDMHTQKAEGMPMKKHGAGMDMSGDNQMHDLDKHNGMKQKAGMPEMKPASGMDKQMHDMDTQNSMKEKAGMPMTKPATAKEKQNDRQMHDLDQH